MGETGIKQYFGYNLAKLLAGKISDVHPGFDSPSFLESVHPSIGSLELKARVNLIAVTLRKHLPQDYRISLSILLKILGKENQKETGMFTTGYWLMPVAKYVELYGLEEFKASTRAIYEITKRHTGEYAIRPFLRKYPKKTIRIMEKWARDDNVHVRRLASEGLRSRLPWANRINLFCQDPTPVIEVLEHLKSDRSVFVRKSVANNLNDILKDNYAAAIAVLTRWHKNATSETRWIIKHALRNEIRRKNPAAIALVR